MISSNLESYISRLSTYKEQLKAFETLDGILDLLCQKKIKLIKTNELGPHKANITRMAGLKSFNYTIYLLDLKKNAQAFSTYKSLFNTATNKSNFVITYPLTEGIIFHYGYNSRSNIPNGNGFRASIIVYDDAVDTFVAAVGIKGASKFLESK